MSFIDIKKLKTVKDCDTLIVTLMQEGYKKYLEGKDGARELVAAAEVMRRSQVLQERQLRRERTKERLNKKLLDDKQKDDTISDLGGDNFRGI